MPSARAEFGGGLRAVLPIAVGVVPFGMIYGVLALAAGLPPLLAQAMSSIVFAGSAQFIGVQLIAGGVPTAVLWLTTLVVNLRHMLYSTALAPYVKHLPARWRWLLAYLLTDEAFAVTILHYQQSQPPPANRHWYFFGAGIGLWSWWQASTAVGILVGAQIPASWSLDFALPLTFIGLVVPVLRRRSDVAAAIVAGLAAVLAFGLPLRLGLILATLAGIVAGVWLGRLLREGGAAPAEGAPS